MSTEADRKDYGMTDKGAVFVIHFINTDDNDVPVHSYQVRHGVRTVGVYDSPARAASIARGIAG